MRRETARNSSGSPEKDPKKERNDAVARHRAKSGVEDKRVSKCGIGTSSAEDNYGRAWHGVNLHHI
jgi:hypothetical protein